MDRRRTPDCRWVRQGNKQNEDAGTPTSFSDPALSPQGGVESLRLALGGSVAKAGALTDCPFQGDSTAYNTGKLRPLELD